MDKLFSLFKKKELLVAGLISGTSADGIDTCLVKIKEVRDGLKIKLLGFKTYEYADSIRQKIFELYKDKNHDLDDLVRLSMFLGKSFAQAVIDLCKKLGINKNRLDLIGSHGQTIRHLPKVANFCGEKTRGTLQ
ncbi:MAG: anhydro-N-acetylmuramic acid kinase, partial [candidate division Zixibacteria bacterium]|nr:anhydro-N-acetylmuramic acid kinase [candidate division Zixibacteria bacterium]